MPVQMSPTLGALDLRGDGRPTVVLRHDLPDGSHHFDWLLAGDPLGALPLPTFRLQIPLPLLAPGQCLSAQRVADHRPMYLHYQGPVSGNRGHVQRHGEGRLISVRTPEFDVDDASWVLGIAWTGPEQDMTSSSEPLQILRLQRTMADVWRIENVSSTESGDGERPSAIQPV